MTRLVPPSKVEPHPYREFERAGWKRASAAYGDTFEDATRIFVSALADAARVARGQQVLDVACGTGAFAAEAAARGATVAGLDFSPEMIAAARRRHPGLRFSTGDAEALAFRDGSFDAVASNFGVHHFPFPARALAEARRVLRPGGRIAFSVWAPPAEHVLQRLAVDAVRIAGNAEVEVLSAPQGAISDAGRCAALLREAGFADSTIGVDRAESALELASVEALQRLVLQGTVRMAALITRQPEERRTAILAALAGEARRYLLPGGERLRIPVVALIAYAGT